jgi:hypothetical protein
MVSEELKKEIGNAFAAYAWVLSSASLYCDIPKQFEIFKGIEPEEVQRRLRLLQNFYNQI